MAADGNVRPTDSPPVANAGPDQTVDEDSLVTFDGSGSTDDVGIANYTWIVPGNLGIVRKLVDVTTPGSGVFDPVRPFLYLVSQTQVSFLNLTSGAVDTSLPIAHSAQWPLSFGVSSDGSYLAVGIPTGPRGYTEFGPYESYFASFDLVNRTKIGEFRIAEDAYKTLVTRAGGVIVSGGSGQWAYLHVYNAWNGTEAPQRTIIWQYDQIALHPSERRVYSADQTGIYPQGVDRHDFDPAIGFTGYWHWPHHGVYYPGDGIWANPRGDQLVTGSGLLLTSTNATAQDMTYLTQFPGPVTAVAFAVEQGVIALAEGSGIDYYDMDTYAFLGSVNLGAAALALAIRGDEVLAFTGNQVVAADLPRILLYGVSPSHVFPNPGVYLITLIVRDTAGQSATNTMTVTVRDVTPPTADAGPERTMWRQDVVTFDGTRSTDNVGIVTYAWTFTDGGPQTLTGANVSYRFQNRGTFVVTLTVLDAAGNAGADTLTVVVNVDIDAPIADAGADETVREGTRVVFDGSRSTDNVGIVSWRWTFLDGGPQSFEGLYVQYRFVTPGTFDVTLTVRDLEGNEGTDTLTVRVLAVSLVSYEHAAHGYRIGLPEGWDVQRDSSLGGPPNDFIAFAPFSLNQSSTLVVASTAAFGAASEADLLALAESTIGDLERRFGSLIVLETPGIVTTASAKAAVFEVCFSFGFLCELVGVAGSARAFRTWTIVLSASSESGIEDLRPYFNAAIRTLTILDPFDNPVARTALVSVGGVTLAAVPLLIVGLRRSRGRRKVRAPRNTRGSDEAPDAPRGES